MDYISIRDISGEDWSEEAADVGEGERDADHRPGEHRRHVGRTYLWGKLMWNECLALRDWMNY